MRKRLFISIAVVVALISGLVRIFSVVEKQIAKSERNVYGKLEQARLFNDWLWIMNKGYSIGEYLLSKGYDHVAIYGLSNVGCRLKERLEKEGVSVDYGIDRNSLLYIENMDLYSPDDKLPDTGVIIVTPLLDQEDICAMLQKKVNCEVLSIRDVISDITMQNV